MADKMWDILRFLKNPGDEAAPEAPLPQESQSEKDKINVQLIDALSKAEEAADAALRQEKSDNRGIDEGENLPLADTQHPNPTQDEEGESSPESDENSIEQIKQQDSSETGRSPDSRENAGEKLLEIPLSQIAPNPFQPRKLMGEEEIIELSDSIKELGVLQPILVRRTGDSYELIAGERRFKAAQRAGLEKIPAMVMETDQVHQQIIALVENIQRKNLSAIEEARCLQDILAKTGWSQTELAKRMGRSQAAIANKIRLLKLDNSVQDLVIAGKLGERQARSLLGLSLQEQGELAQKAVSEDLSARVLETLSETWQSKSGPGKRISKKEKSVSDGPAGELLHDLAALINRHRNQGIPAQWKVKQMDQSSLIVEISVDLNRNKAQYGPDDAEVANR